MCVPQRVSMSDVLISASGPLRHCEQTPNLRAQHTTSRPPFGIHFRLVIGSSSSALSPLAILSYDYVRVTVTYSHD